MAAEIALPQGYALHEYRIEQTLGIGGFGLTYLATDSNLNLKVAIKEYLPGDLAQRGEDQSVRPKSESTSESFKWGLSRFLDESRTLASFRHPNIVRVLRFFEANSTAYMVMEFVAGQPLGEWIRSRRPLEESTVFAINSITMYAVLFASKNRVHGDGIYCEHRAFLERPAAADPFTERLPRNEFHHHVRGAFRFEDPQDLHSVPTREPAE